MIHWLNLIQHANSQIHLTRIKNNWFLRIIYPWIGHYSSPYKGVIKKKLSKKTEILISLSSPLPCLLKGSIWNHMRTHFPDNINNCHKLVFYCICNQKQSEALLKHTDDILLYLWKDIKHVKVWSHSQFNKF